MRGWRGEGEGGGVGEGGKGGRGGSPESTKLASQNSSFFSMVFLCVHSMLHGRRAKYHSTIHTWPNCLLVRYLFAFSKFPGYM